MKYLIEVEVDEEKLKAAKCEGMSEADIADMSIEGMIIEEMGWVGDSGIYLTSIKEVESDVTGEYEDKKLTGAWAFVEKYYPEYSSSDEIARANDLDVILTESDGNWGESAQLMWKNELSQSFPEAARVNDELLVRIYQDAIKGYIESLKGEK